MSIKDENFERFLKANFESDWHRYTSSEATEETKFSIMSNHQRAYGVYKRLSDSGLLKNDYLPPDLLSGQITVDEYFVRIQEFLGQNIVYENGHMIAVRMQYAENLPNMVYNEDPVKRISRVVELAQKAGLDEQSTKEVVNIERDCTYFDHKNEKLGIPQEQSKKVGAYAKFLQLAALVDQKEQEGDQKAADGISIVLDEHLKENNISDEEAEKFLKDAIEEKRKLMQHAVDLSVQIHIAKSCAEKSESQEEREQAQKVADVLTVIRKKHMEECNISEEDIKEDVKKAIEKLDEDDRDVPPGGGGGNTPPYNTDQDKISIEENKGNTSPTEDKGNTAPTEDKTNSDKPHDYSISANTSHKSIFTASDFSFCTPDDEAKTTSEGFDISKLGITIPGYDEKAPSYSIDRSKSLIANISDNINSAEDCNTKTASAIAARTYSSSELDRLYEKQKARLVANFERKKQETIKNSKQRIAEKKSANLNLTDDKKTTPTTTPSRVAISSTKTSSGLDLKDYDFDL